MHPFGGTPICPTCNKAVYAAEQIMGPGRKLYHKPCLACTTCRKRLDSYSLVEHNQEPYCKQCHIKNFGTRDLRHANLPDRDDVLSSPPTSPPRATTFSPKGGTSPLLPSRNDGAPALPPRNASPAFRPTRTLSPGRFVNAETGAAPSIANVSDTNSDKNEEDWELPVVHNTPANLGRSAGGLPRTVALQSTMTGPPRAESAVKESLTPVQVLPTASGNGVLSSGQTQLGGRMSVPLTPGRTGTRYGMALRGYSASPMAPTATGRPWSGGGGNPACGKCGKTVYFAEQVKAIGKTFHKNCLRCTECNKLLDSTRLNENEGNPFCNHCYGKLHGPAGSGYALLGKAGG